jgi:hypothetical protein
MAIAKGTHPMSYHPVFRLDDYTLRPPRSHEEVLALQKATIPYYGEMAWTVEDYEAWLAEFAYGVMLLFDGEKLVGNFDIWPMTAENLQVIAMSQVPQPSLRPVRLSHVLNNSGHDDWYVASLLLLLEHRDHQTRRCFSQMICMALNNMVDSGLIRFPAQISAVGSSPEGQQLLEHVGLRHDPSAKITWGKFYRHAMPTRHDFFWPTIRTTGVEQLVEPLTTPTT